VARGAWWLWQDFLVDGDPVKPLVSADWWTNLSGCLELLLDTGRLHDCVGCLFGAALMRNREVQAGLSVLPLLVLAAFDKFAASLF